jgi:hydrogenase nickel incorporation protein HypA/HybF
MHEFSLAADVVELAAREAEKHAVSRILEMDIEVGALSGVDADAFREALKLVVENTLLSQTVIRLNRKSGRGICPSCRREFEMKERIAFCPDCGELPSEITGGLEFRVVSLLAE